MCFGGGCPHPAPPPGREGKAITVYPCTKGAEMDLVSKKGLTPLAEAAKAAHTELVKLLCERGAKDSKSRQNNSFQYIYIVDSVFHIYRCLLSNV